MKHFFPHFFLHFFFDFFDFFFDAFFAFFFDDFDFEEVGVEEGGEDAASQYFFCRQHLEAVVQHEVNPLEQYTYAVSHSVISISGVVAQYNE